MRDDRHFTDAKRQLREIAINDWAYFCKLIGDESITNALICMLRLQQRGKSMPQISDRLSITLRKTQYIIENKCPCEKMIPDINSQNNNLNQAG